jgi:hypothetical protein
MTAKELIDLIATTFAADEEVTFLVEGQEGQEHVTKVTPRIDRRKIMDGQWYVKRPCEVAMHPREDWFKVKKEVAMKTPYYKRKFVPNGKTHIEVKRVLEIG